MTDNALPSEGQPAATSAPDNTVPSRMVSIPAGQAAGAAKVARYFRFLREVGICVAIVAALIGTLAASALVAHGVIYGADASTVIIAEALSRIDFHRTFAIILGGLLWLAVSFPMTLYLMGRMIGHYEDNRHRYVD